LCPLQLTSRKFVAVLHACQSREPQKILDLVQRTSPIRDMQKMWKLTASGICQVLNVILAFFSFYLLRQGWLSRRLKSTDIKTDGKVSWSSLMFKNLRFMLNLGSFVAIWTATFARFLGDYTVEFTSWAATSIFMWCNALLLCLPFQFIGPILVSM
jgi:hypothetical protein